GQRVVITRTSEQAGELGSRFARLGAETLEIPTIRVIAPTERTPMIEALAGLGEYDWIVFSSANGVDAFFHAIFAAFEDIRTLGQLRLAAVGSSTAARLKQLHLKVDAVPTEFVGKNIAAAIGATESLENLRLLVARAQNGNPDLCGELEKLGAIVDDVAFYQTVPETEDRSGDAAALVERGADWITFTSSSTVENFHRRFDLPALVKKHPHLRLASIGPETSKTLRALGLAPHVEAKPHTLDALVEAVLKASKS
ncbi:MAG: uroporphyrinogen-III synthase, partial [Verrucomicrobiales bacterium]|nr:uroporphyrinogen-III synthase [Verrucomicrobiales bacterium]